MSQAILQCLPLLADILGRAYGVIVEIGGSEAFTTGKVIRLPSLPASGDPGFLGLLRGYIDHESAHIRHTDFAAMNQAGMSPLEKNIWNFFEDWRVENELAISFPGCRQNFQWLIRHLFLQQPTHPRLSVFVVLDWLLMTVRSWDVPELIPSCLEEAARMDRLWPGLRCRLESILATMRGNCPDSLACLDYARQVIGCLKESARSSRTNEVVTPSPPNLAGDGASGGKPSQRAGGHSTLHALLNAVEKDLPEDLGKTLQRSVGEGSALPGRCAVAGIGGKTVKSLSNQELAEIQQVTAGLRARFLGLLQGTRLVRQTPSRRGKLDSRRLHGVVLGEPQLFLTHNRKPAINTAVHLLLDCSSSMLERIGLACQCCHAAAQALSQSGLSVGITAFPGSEPGTVVPLLRQGERLHANLLIQARGMTPLGEALWWVLQRFAPLPEDRKIILIITDGSPDNSRSTKEAIQAGETLGIEILGLGIDAPQIRTLLPKTSRNIDKLQDLPTALFAVLQQALLQQGAKS